MHVAMVLTDKKIRELVKKEELIVPFNESNLQSESYDVTIGTEITELSKEIHCIDISKQETYKWSGKKQLPAECHREVQYRRF